MHSKLTAYRPCRNHVLRLCTVILGCTLVATCDSKSSEQCLDAEIVFEITCEGGRGRSEVELSVKANGTEVVERTGPFECGDIPFTHRMTTGSAAGQVWAEGSLITADSRLSQKLGTLVPGASRCEPIQLRFGYARIIDGGPDAAFDASDTGCIPNDVRCE